MIRLLPHIFARVYGVPLLIAQRSVEPLIVGLWAATERRGSAIEPAMFDADDITPAEQEPRVRSHGYRVDRGIALLPVRGVLVRRAGQVDADSTELQSYERIRRSLASARSNSRVRGILMEIDTPGGEAGGIFELANEIRATNREKPVWAIANDDALSAGYAIAAAANKVWITDTGAAGSIGVIALHLDQSAFDEKEGRRFNYVFRGLHKIDGNPHAPLSASATMAIQGEVDRLYEMLIASVANHRGDKLLPERARATEAAIYAGENAVREGLADQLGTLEQAHDALAVATVPNSRRAMAQSNRRTTNMEDDNGLGPSAEVVNLDQVRSAGVVEGRNQAREIAALCRLAGYPELTEEHIGSGASLEAVRAALQVRQAAASAQRQVEAIDVSRPARDAQLAELNNLVAAHFAASHARPHA
jgi:signal peptide peptidase SppA